MHRAIVVQIFTFIGVDENHLDITCSKDPAHARARASRAWQFNFTHPILRVVRGPVTGTDPKKNEFCNRNLFKYPNNRNIYFLFSGTGIGDPRTDQFKTSETLHRKYTRIRTVRHLMRYAIVSIKNRRIDLSPKLYCIPKEDK